MCGIVGGFGSRCQKRDILTGLELLQHRGKDERFFAQCGSDVFLGMNRLSIQDSQPGLYPFKFKQYSLIMNGELYNLPELTKLLKGHGIHCKTKCDAEVILPLFDIFGVEAFQKLDGMFAIAIYDEKKKIFTFARDLFGEKPLYYTKIGKSCFFASELQALPQFTHQVNESVIPEYLTFGFLNSNRTFYKDVFKVLPGECVEVSETKIVKQQYDILSKYIDKPIKNKSQIGLINELDSSLQKIAQKKITGESPIGLFLSGGLDSSLLAALVQKETKNKLFTYSIGFANRKDDESADANLMARKLNSKHQHLSFSDQDVPSIWEHINSRGDEPFSDPAILPTYLLAQSAKSDVKVVLTGEGADEIFGGYNRYQNFALSRKTTFSPLATLLQKTALTPLKLYKLFANPRQSYSPVSYEFLWNSVTNREKYLGMIEQVWDETITIEGQMTDLVVPQNLQLYDLRHYVAEQLCMKTDKILMLHDIESRAPYLDRSLLPFLRVSGRIIANLPTGQSNKLLLRKVAARYLPEEIVHKSKHGFSLPLAELLQSTLREKTESLYHAHPMITNFVTQSEITHALHAFFNGDLKRKNDIWNLLTLQTWLVGQDSLRKKA